MGKKKSNKIFYSIWGFPSFSRQPNRSKIFEVKKLTYHILGHRNSDNTKNLQQSLSQNLMKTLQGGKKNNKSNWTNLLDRACYAKEIGFKFKIIKSLTCRERERERERELVEKKEIVNKRI